MGILDPLTFAFLLIGSSLPYWFSAMTMKSVGKAAKLMIRKVELQFKQNPDLLNPNTKVVRKGFFYECCLTAMLFLPLHP